MARGRPVVDGVDIVYLLDTQSPLDVQLRLLSIDALAYFARGDGPLPVLVVHRGSVTDAGRRFFSGVPGLQCQHMSLDGASTPELEAAMGIHWRDYAALAVARLTTSRFYLILSDSAVCVRPLAPVDLLLDGLALSQWEPLTRHRDCYDGCRQLLKAEETGGEGLSTLPAIFNTDLALRTLKRLEEVGGKGGADEKLAAACAQGLPWSANALYSVACQSELRRHHSPSSYLDRYVALHGDANVWFDADDLSAWDPVQWVSKATHGQFLVLKSEDPDRARVMASRCYALLR